jgi:hypothetical protein
MLERPYAINLSFIEYARLAGGGEGQWPLI